MRAPLLHETLRQWNIKFAPLLTEKLCHREPRRGSRWFPDGVCVELGGRKHWLLLARTDCRRERTRRGTPGRWRAVDETGVVLDIRPPAKVTTGE